MEEFNVSLNNFDGPFSVLLHLIDIHDIDLYDIEIALLTDQFLIYIEEHSGTLADLSEFLVMASRLLEIKSSMLLPNSSSFDDDIVVLDEEDPRLWLVESLLEYKKYRDASNRLEPLYHKYSGRYSKNSSYYNNSDRARFINGDKVIDSAILSEIFNSILFRMPVMDENRALYFENFSFTRYNVEEIREEIYALIKRKNNLSFFDLVLQHDEIDYKISAFLAILELMKYENIEAVQDSVNGDIKLVYL